MFIKIEKIPFTEGGKVNPDPRAIQFRDPRFSVVFAKYIKAIEQEVYQLRGNRLNGLPVTRVFGKGMNSVDKAELLVTKWKQFKRCVVLPLDASRFDQHLDTPHLEALHYFYSLVIPCPEFAQLCKQTLVNRVRTSKNVRYVAVGGRMSGDMDTALGACLFMLGFLTTIMKEYAVHYDMLDDGDDVLLFLEYDDYERIAKELPSRFLAMGQEIKIEDPCFEIEEIEWCQGHPVFIDGHYKFVRNPSKVLSGALVGPKWLQMRSERSRRALANTIGLGEGILNQGVPILQSFAMAITRNAATERQVKLGHNDSLTYKVRHEIGKSRLQKMPTFEARPVSDEARESFARAFGIAVSDQLMYEAYFDAWEFSFRDPELQEVPVDVPTWTWTAFETEKQ